MNSNNNVDQAAALILCSTATARRLGIAEDKWIYPWAGTDAHDHYFVSNRDNFYSSPAIRFAGNRCLELAGVEARSLDHVDLYSCFPVAVQVSAAELGLDEQRPLTVTGGLTFGGGPMNNYVMHSIARMAEVLRDDRDADRARHRERRLPHEARVRRLFRDAAVARVPTRRSAGARSTRRRNARSNSHYSGPARVESYTVMYGNDGPTVGHVACLLPERRARMGQHQRPRARSMR